MIRLYSVKTLVIWIPSGSDCSLFFPLMVKNQTTLLVYKKDWRCEKRQQLKSLLKVLHLRLQLRWWKWWKCVAMNEMCCFVTSLQGVVWDINKMLISSMEILIPKIPHPFFFPLCLHSPVRGWNTGIPTTSSSALQSHPLLFASDHTFSVCVWETDDPASVWVSGVVLEWL